MRRDFLYDGPVFTAGAQIVRGEISGSRAQRNRQGAVRTLIGVGAAWTGQAVLSSSARWKASFAVVARPRFPAPAKFSI